MNAALARRIAAGPKNFPHTLDLIGEQVLLVELNESQIAEASFLDQRILNQGLRGGWVSLDEVAASAPATMRDDAGLIFHIGHCGSTLISRLLDQVPGILGIREPQSLRDMATLAVMRDRPDCPWDPVKFGPRLILLRKLLARTFVVEQRAIVKTTSFVSDLAPALLADGNRAVFIYQSPRRYSETILSGENSRSSLAALTGPRLNRLHARIGESPWRFWRMDEGQRIALGWAVEMAALAAAAEAISNDAVLWVDFDAFLAAPAEQLRAIAKHFGSAIDPVAAQEIVSGPHMQRYSKAPEYAYSSQIRETLLREAWQDHKATIKGGLAWLAEAASAYPAIAAALDRAGEV